MVCSSPDEGSESPSSLPTQRGGQSSCNAPWATLGQYGTPDRYSYRFGMGSPWLRAEPARYTQESWRGGETGRRGTRVEGSGSRGLPLVDFC
jgi:hypothetical protein